MKKIMLLVFCCIGGVAFGQYVSSTTVQNQILKDQAIINSCLEAISAANDDMQSIINDEQAQPVTKDVPEISADVNAIIESSKTVGVTPIDLQPTLDVSGTLNEIGS